MENILEPQKPKKRRWILIIVIAILAILGIGFILTVIGIFSLVKGQAVPVRDNSTLVLRMEGLVQEEPAPNDPFTELFGAKVLSVHQIEEALQKAKTDNRIKSLFVDIRECECGFAKLQEIRDAILDFKSSKKPSVAYFEFAGNGGYYLASACDKVYMPPAGMLLFNGLASEVPFIRGTLDKLGIEPQLYHIGDYKSASDIITRKDMSDAQREVTNSILDDILNQITSDVEKERKIPHEKMTEALNLGFFLASQAKENNLIDDTMYLDEVIDKVLKNANGNKGELINVSYSNYIKDHKMDLYAGAKSKIGLLYTSGSIISGESEGQGNNKQMGSDTIAKLIRKLRKDKTIKAVVMRVDSPGGSGLASDVIWHETLLLKKEKPLIVSMSDVAGSGGYYIAMGADSIVAEKGTITGSIGVISGKFILKGFFDWIGINHEIIKKGENSDLFSANVKFSDSQAALIQAQMEVFYKDFVQKAADGRHKTWDEINTIGQGRIWTGQQAKANGLVDEIGGIPLALDIAKKKAKIPDAEKVRVVIYPKPKSFIETIVSAKKEEDEAKIYSSMPSDLIKLIRTYRDIKTLEKYPYLAYMPIFINPN